MICRRTPAGMLSVSERSAAGWASTGSCGRRSRSVAEGRLRGRARFQRPFDAGAGGGDRGAWARPVGGLLADFQLRARDRRPAGRTDQRPFDRVRGAVAGAQAGAPVPFQPAVRAGLWPRPGRSPRRSRRRRRGGEAGRQRVDDRDLAVEHRRGVAGGVGDAHDEVVLAVGERGGVERSCRRSPRPGRAGGRGTPAARRSSRRRRGSGRRLRLSPSCWSTWPSTSTIASYTPEPGSLAWKATSLVPLTVGSSASPPLTAKTVGPAAERGLCRRRRAPPRRRSLANCPRQPDIRLL